MKEVGNGLFDHIGTFAGIDRIIMYRVDTRETTGWLSTLPFLQEKWYSIS